MKSWSKDEQQSKKTEKSDSKTGELLPQQQQNVEYSPERVKEEGVIYCVTTIHSNKLIPVQGAGLNSEGTALSKSSEVHSPGTQQTGHKLKIQRLQRSMV